MPSTRVSRVLGSNFLRKVGSSCCSRAKPWAIFSSSPLFLEWMDSAVTGLGKLGGASFTGRVRSANVSPVWVSLSLTAATMSPAVAAPHSRRSLPIR